MKAQDSSELGMDCVVAKMLASLKETVDLCCMVVSLTLIRLQNLMLDFVLQQSQTRPSRRFELIMAVSVIVRRVRWVSSAILKQKNSRQKNGYVVRIGERRLRTTHRILRCGSI